MRSLLYIYELERNGIIGLYTVNRNPRLQSFTPFQRESIREPLSWGTPIRTMLMDGKMAYGVWRFAPAWDDSTVLLCWGLGLGLRGWGLVDSYTVDTRMASLQSTGRVDPPAAAPRTTGIPVRCPGGGW
jgi:hypothetical protein